MDKALQQINRFLFRPVDNSALLLFRILFGAIVAADCIQYILTGSLRKYYIAPQYSFPHIAMEWLQPLPGYGMYFYFAAMAGLGVLVMAGYRYRQSLLLLTMLWGGAYFMQKTYYVNHHYLMFLVCIIMLWLPANAGASVDSRLNPALRQNTMPAWYSHIMVLQIGIVYFFAALAKLYPGWLDGTFMGILMSYVKHPWAESVFSSRSLLVFMSYGGLIYDLVIVGLLLYRPTRDFALLLSLFFHLFNWLTLKVGVFPFLSLAFIPFFYPPETIRKYFFRPVQAAAADMAKNPGKRLLAWFFIPYFLLQFALPVRHYFIKGDVLWTEEGSRMAWRMMLRKKTGTAKFIVQDKARGDTFEYDVTKLLTKSQIYHMASKPDMVWQTAQLIKREYALKAIHAAVYVDCKASINGGPERRIIDQKADLSAAEWDHFYHNEWIIPYPEE